MPIDTRHIEQELSVKFGGYVKVSAATNQDGSTTRVAIPMNKLIDGLSSFSDMGQFIVDSTDGLDGLRFYTDEFLGKLEVFVEASPWLWAEIFDLSPESILIEGA